MEKKNSNQSPAEIQKKQNEEKKNRNEKKINYWNLIKRAFKITIQHRFLWVFGIFLALATGGGGGGNMGTSEGFKDDNWDSFLRGYTGNPWERAEMFWREYLFLILLLAGLVLVIVLALKILGIISEGALIDGINKADAGIKTDFKKAFRAGRMRFWRLLGIKLISVLIALVSLAVVASPVIFFLITKTYLVAVPLLILGILVYLLIAVFLFLVTRLASLLAVCMNYPIWSAYGEAYSLFSKKIGKVLFMLLIQLVIGFLGGIGMIVLIFPLLLIGIITTGVFYLSFKIIGAILAGGVMLLLIIAALLLLRGILEVFLYSIWVLFFKEIKGEKIKIKEKKRDSLKKIASKVPVN